MERSLLTDCGELSVRDQTRRAVVIERGQTKDMNWAGVGSVGVRHGKCARIKAGVLAVGKRIQLFRPN